MSSTDFLTSPVYSLIRWVSFSAILTIVGVIGFRQTVLSRVRRDSPGSVLAFATADARAATWGSRAAGILVLASFARLAAQSHMLDGVPVLTVAFETKWGNAWFIQTILANTLAVTFLAAKGGDSFSWKLATVLTALLAFTPGLGGHAIASHHPVLMVAVDGLHVLGGGGWLGTLMIVAAVGIPVALSGPPSERGADVAALIRAFSPTALVCASVVVATGIFASWVHLGTLNALVHTQYGQRLLYKVGGVVAAGGLGAYHWQRAKPLLGDEASAAAIRKSAWVEVGIGGYIVMITAVLVATAFD